MFLNFKKVVFSFIVLLLAFIVIGCNNNNDKINVDELLAEAKTKILVGSEINNLTSDLNLQTKVIVDEIEIPVVWTATQSQYFVIGQVNSTGQLKATVTRPEYGQPQAEITLTATLTYENVSVTRDWSVFVKPKPFVKVSNTKTVKEEALKVNVEITATVSYVISGGYFIHDEFGGLYVYTSSAPAAEIKPGAVVKVTGVRGDYYGMPQITTPSHEVITPAPTAGYDYSAAPNEAISSIISGVNSEQLPYARIVKVEGLVEKDFNKTFSDYSLFDTINNVRLHIANSSVADAKTELADKVGKYVRISVIVYEYRTDHKVWRVLAIPKTITEITAPVLSDEVIMSRSKTELTDLFNGKEFSANLTLPATTSHGATVTWASNNTAVIDNDGKFTAPINATQVILTATIVAGALTDTHEVTVTAKQMITLTVKQALDAIDAAKASGTSTVVVKVEGIIIAKDRSDNFYLADSTGVLFVYGAKLANNNLVIGNRIQVVGTGKVFGSSSYTRQIDGGLPITITKLDEDIHTPPMDTTVVTFADFTSEITSENYTTLVPQEDLYGKIFKIEGYIKTFPNGTNTDIWLYETAEGSTRYYIYHGSFNTAALLPYENLKVTITAVVYDYQVTNGWRLGFLGREGDISTEGITETEKLAIAKAEVDAIVKENDNVNADLTFKTDTTNSVITGTKYVWTTDDLATIAVDGKFTAPAADKVVKVTVKVFLDGNIEGTPNATWDINVTAKATVVAPTTDLFFSEYGEGSSNNKWLEIYNPTGQTVDLSVYKVLTYSNGATTATNTLQLTGTLAAGQVIVIVNAAIVASAKPTGAIESTVTYFNGDDAIGLYKNDVLIDQFGIIGEDPGTFWAVGTGSTLDYTLIRKATVAGPNAVWNANEWDVLAKDTFTNIGTHTYTPAN